MSKYFILFLTVFLTGCVTAPRIPDQVAMNTKYQQKNIPVNINFYGVKNIVPTYGYLPTGSISDMGYQQGVSMGSAGAGVVGGILAGGIINTAIENEANNMVEPLIKATKEVDFRELLSNSIKEAFVQNDLVNIKEIKFKDKNKKRSKRWTVYEPFIDVYYKFYVLPNLSQVGLTATVEFYHPDSEVLEVSRKRLPIPIFKNTFSVFSDKIPEPVKTQEEIDTQLAKVLHERKKLSQSKRSNVKVISEYNKKIKRAKRATYTLKERNEKVYAIWIKNNGELINQKFEKAKLSIVKKLELALANTSEAPTLSSAKVKI